MRNISLSGSAGAGKDTLAALIIAKYNYRRVAFADELKRIAGEYFFWDGAKDQKGRTLLQLLGTEVGRSMADNLWLYRLAKVAGFPTEMSLPDEAQSLEAKTEYLHHYYDDQANSNEETRARLVSLIEFGWDGVWTPRVQTIFESMTAMTLEYSAQWGEALPPKEFYLSQLQKMHSLRSAVRAEDKVMNRVVVTDTRFPNEGDFLKNNGFLAGQIIRPGTVQMGHASETSMADYDFDFTVLNNQGVEELEKQLEGPELLRLLSEKSEAGE